MPTSQGNHWHRTVPLESEIQNRPQCTVVADTAAHSTEGIPAMEPTAAAQFRFRILVVDDEPSIRGAVREILESQGYEVLTAADGLDGLHALSKSLPDLIISDLNMPRMSGFEFLAIVRARFPHIATIAVSGRYIAAEIRPGSWRTLSCKRVPTLLKRFPAKSRSSWLFLRSGRKGRRASLPHSSRRATRRGI